MQTFLRLVIIFLAVSIGAAVGVQYFGIEFGTVNYWYNRGVFFLFFVTLFPRLTLLFSSVVSGGLIWWVAWLFAPRILVAVLATIAYWNTNKILVMISWLVAIGGESSEKVFIRRRVYTYPRGRHDIEPEYRDVT